MEFYINNLSGISYNRYTLKLRCYEKWELFQLIMNKISSKKCRLELFSEPNASLCFIAIVSWIIYYFCANHVSFHRPFENLYLFIPLNISFFPVNEREAGIISLSSSFSFINYCYCCFLLFLLLIL